MYASRRASGGCLGRANAISQRHARAGGRGGPGVGQRRPGWRREGKLGAGLEGEERKVQAEGAAWGCGPGRGRGCRLSGPPPHQDFGASGWGGGTVSIRESPSAPRAGRVGGSWDSGGGRVRGLVGSADGAWGLLLLLRACELAAPLLGASFWSACSLYLQTVPTALSFPF